MRLRLKRRRGQALVELAILLPLLVMLLLGLADFGFLLYAHVQVANAAREGARAGSLYLGGRFHYTACQSDCPSGYGDGGSNPACWTLRDWVENGLVQRNRDDNGCPASGFDTSVHALGLLNTDRCPSATDGDCWLLQPLTSNGTAITGLPVAGSPLEVQLVYRFTPPLVGDFIGLDENPIVITRTVVMKVQNN